MEESKIATDDGRTDDVDSVRPPATTAERGFLQFPVVGLGASAGGLEALEIFFRNTPDDSGMAYIVVQHLSPEHQSLLANILTRHTRMPVHEITDGMSIAPDNVYVIAPGYTLTLAGGRLHLGEPVEKRGHRRPVDDFLRSLAEEQKEKAIAVILSGTGTNGTAGAQAIKAAGGICVAQSPETATFPGMPRSLIDAGYADQVLDPQDIPEVLQRYASHPYVGTETDARAAEESLQRDRAHLREVLAILRTRTRHDFSGYRKPTLSRRIQRRMGLSEVATLGEYADLLRETPSEATALANDLMINVTGFFRDPDAWETLRTTVIEPLLTSKRSGEQLRCWVTACASGEEAYTLAMLISEEARTRNLERLEVKIFATDTADKSLSLARSGVFPGGIEADIPPERLDRFFDRNEHTYQVKKEIRDMVVFAPQDVLRDPPFSKIDLCTCRNLLIYLEPETQRRVLSLLHFSLRDGGYLFLGNTETHGDSDHLFEVVNKKWRIYRHSGPAHQRITDIPLFVPRTAEFASRLAEASADGSLPMRASATLVLQRALLDRYGPPTVVVDRADNVVYFHGPTDEFLRYPAGEPTRDLMQLVRPAFRSAVRTVLRTAVRENRATTIRVERAAHTGLETAVEVTAEPVLQGKAPEYFSVSFRVPGPTSLAGTAEVEVAPAIAADPHAAGEPSERDEIRALRRELQNTIEAFEATSEELKASNEEATSINEELQSTNEELETGKEELQSVNEELTTVNTQLQSKIHELEATTNDLANLLSSTDIAVIFLDAEFRVRRFTPATNDLLELIDTDIGRPITDLAQKFTDRYLLEDAKHVLQRLIPIEREVLADSGRWYLRRTLPYRTADNKIEGVVITFIDVGVRKRAEQEHIAAQQRLQAVLDQMPLAVLITHAPSGRLLSANQCAAELFGAVVPVPVPQNAAQPVYPLLQVSHPSGQPYRPDEWPMARSLARNSAVIDEEVEITDPHGQRRILSVSAAPVRDASGATVAVVTTFADITRRRAAERSTREAEERFRLLVENATDFGIFFVDPQGDIAIWNKGAERLLGWTEDEIVGRPLATLFTLEDRSAGLPDRELRQARETGRSADDRWHLRKDGTSFWASGVLTPVHSPGGAVTGFVKVMRDTTERKVSEDRLFASTLTAKRAQAEADNANRAKDEFISTVSHELRTPLNTIRLWARMLAASNLSASDRAEGIQMVERATIAQQRLIDDLLDVSRIASGKLRLSLRETRLADAIESAIAAVQPASQTRGVRMSTQIGPDIGVVRADPDRIQQVVWNLLSNAVKFTPMHGVVEVSARRDGDTVEIAVSDSGIGIREDFLPLVFDRFRQAEVGVTRAHSGLGLGLAIAKELVELHQGTLTVASEGEGRGSTFTIRLPLPLRPPMSPDASAQTSPIAYDLAGIDIVLVDDEPFALDTMRRLFERSGASVRAVDGAAAARDAMAAKLPDILVSDIGMPGEDGYSLLKSIRALEREGYANVPALALTAFARPEDLRRALAAGFSAHLAKPVDPDDLLETVERLARGGA